MDTIEGNHRFIHLKVSWLMRMWLIRRGLPLGRASSDGGQAIARVLCLVLVFYCHNQARPRRCPAGRKLEFSYRSQIVFDFSC